MVFAATAVVPALISCGGGNATGSPVTEAATEVVATEAPTEEPPSTAIVAIPTGTSLPLTTPVSPALTGDEIAPALLEFRRLTLEYPLKLKAGAGSDVIRLTLEVDALGNITPTAEVEGNVVQGEVIEIPNLYATHNVTAEAFFDIAGLEVKPSGAILQPMKQGAKLDFHWSVGAQNVGIYHGTIWLYLNFESRSSGEKSRVPVSAQVVEIEAVDFFGFSTNIVKTSGVVGSALGLIIGFPFFDDLLKYLWGRMKGGKKKPGKSTKKK